MKKIKTARIIVTLIASISLITVVVLSILGNDKTFTDEMIITMKAFGGIGMAALIVNLVLALIPIIKNKET